MISLTTADKALKDVYLDVITNQLNTQINPFLARIKKTTNNVYGNNIKKLVPYGVNGGIGAGTENGTLPSASGNKYARFEATLKNLYGTVEITDKAIRASENSEGAFLNLLNAEMEGLVNASQFNFARMLFGDGTGALSTVVMNNGNVVSVEDDTYLAEGMIIDIYNGDSLIAGGLMIESMGIDENDYTTITLTGGTLPESIPDTAIIYMQNSKDLEITGLKAIFGDSETLYGVNRANNNWVNPLTYEQDGIPSFSQMRKMIDEMERTCGSIANYIICSPGVKRAFVNFCNDNDIPVETAVVDGFRAIMFDGIPMVADRFCPKGTMFILNTDDFVLHQLCDWRWLEGEDGKILKQKAGQPVYTATLVKYCELICNRPRGQAMITNIREA